MCTRLAQSILILFRCEFFSATARFVLSGTEQLDTVKIKKSKRQLRANQKVYNFAQTPCMSTGYNFEFLIYVYIYIYIYI